MFFVGVSFGAMFTLNVVVASELWGVKQHGQNYMLFDGVTSVFGTLGMAKYVTQTVYRRQPWASLPLSSDIHLNVLKDTYDHSCH